MITALRTGRSSRRSAISFRRLRMIAEISCGVYSWLAHPHGLGLAHAPLDRSDRAIGIQQPLVARLLADQKLPGLGDTHHRGQDLAALLVGQDFRPAVPVHRDLGIRRSQVDADDLVRHHAVSSCSGPALLTITSAARSSSSSHWKPALTSSTTMPGADGHVLRCADHAPHAGIEPPPRHLDPHHAALGQDAIEPSQRDAEAFPPAIRLGLPSPAPALEPARRRHGGLLQPGGQPVAQIEQFKQQRPQQGPPAFPSLGLHALQFLFQRGVARLQRGEDAAELIERLFHQAGFGAHLVAHRGQLDEHREQVRLRRLPRPVPLGASSMLSR